MRIVGDCRDVLPTLPKGSVQMCCTSPPYWGLRDYGVGSKKGEIGQERNIDEYLATMVEVFGLVREVLSDDGTLWLNMGDLYAHNGACGGGSPDGPRKPRATDRIAQQKMSMRVPLGLKPKDLCGMPWRIAFALQADGWYLRSDIIWHKPNPMPESVTDRPTKAHEYLFLLTKNPRYYYDADAVREKGTFQPGTRRRAFTSPRALAMGRQPSGNEVDGWVTESGFRNRRTVWTIATAPFKGAHFATFPPKLVEPCVLAGTSEVGHCPAIVDGKECGARWERVVERGESTWSEKKALGAPMRSGFSQAGGSNVGVADIHTLGWRPTCTHNRKPVPDVCLDPFFGAGTVGMVAEQLGREFLGIELNPRYSKLAREAA